MKKIVLFGILFLALPHTSLAGSASYGTPGTYNFAVPAYSNLTAHVYGGSGSASVDFSGWFGLYFPGRPGGASAFHSLVAPGGGVGGGGGHVTETYNPGQLPAFVTVTVGAGGASPIPEIGAPAGAPGFVSISWTDAPPPSCSMSVTPETTNSGSSAELSWTSAHATSFYISNVGYVTPNTSSSASVAPSATITYTGTASGAGGSAQCSAELSVNESCTFSGDTVSHGSSVTAYQSSTVPYGSSCVSETRTCSSGSLSGSYTYGSCAVSAASCTLDDITVPHGESHTFYASQTAPIGGLCSAVSQSRTCTDGSLSGPAAYQYGSCACAPVYSCSGNNVTFTNSSCSTTTVASCTLPNFCSPGVSSCVTPPPTFNAGSGTSGHLQVRPQLIATGQSASVLWDVGNVTSCSVVGSNGESWSALSGAHSTGALTKRTTYTLTCVPLATHTFTPETAVVNIIPVFQEL